MKGIQYIIDVKGIKTAVLLSLDEWGEVWEDICDILVSESRKDEPTVPWEQLKAEMNRKRHARSAVRR
jgi:hypothetical protein